MEKILFELFYIAWTAATVGFIFMAIKIFMGMKR